MLAKIYSMVTDDLTMCTTYDKHMFYITKTNLHSVEDVRNRERN